MTYEFLGSLYNDLLRLIKGLCVKRYDLALEAETLETSRAFDIYLSCVNGTSYYLTFPKYDYQAMINAGFGEATARSYAADLRNIPESDRETAARYETKYYIENYVERNEYYRMLMGLPPLAAGTRYIYPTDENGKYYYVYTDNITVEGSAGTYQSTIDISDKDYDPQTDTLTLQIKSNPNILELKETDEYQVQIDGTTVNVNLTVPLRAYQYIELRIYRTEDRITRRITTFKFHGDLDGSTDTLTFNDGDQGYQLGDTIRVYKKFRNRTLDESEYTVTDSTIELREPVRDGQNLYVDIEHNNQPIPIHEYTADQIGRLETFGVLDQIKERYPNADYLNYLGTNAIDHLKARLARPFDLLRIGDPSNPRVIELFQREYYFARRYVTANYYNRQQVSDKTLYDPTVGLMILSLAVRNIFALDEKSYLDFDEILNVILDSYGMLKYFKKYPFIYKRRLVIALDALLEHKGTDGVLVDVCKVFSPTQELVADRYYLMKTQKRNPDGSVIESDDPDDAYDLTFLKARIEDRDIHTSEEYRVDYKTVTENDYLWQIEKYGPDGVTITDEYRKLLEDPYNLRMTKYVDAQAAYDITSLTFEVCCFLNMLLESRFFITKMILSNQYATGSNISLKNKFATDGSSQLFTMLVFLLATLAQRAGFDGNIVYDPETIAEVWHEKVEQAEVWHFNYQDLTEEIKSIVDTYELDIDINDVLLKSYAPPTIPDDNFVLDKPTGIPTTSSLVQNYVRNRELFEAIQNTMNTTSSLRQYQGLKMMRDILFTRYVQEETFVKADGELARTYRELLDDLDPRLGTKLDSIVDDEDEMNGVAVYILEQLQDYFRSNDLQYLFLNTPEVYVSLIKRYIEIAINTFKASSVQLRNISVLFLYGDNDPIRIFDEGKTDYHLVLNDEVHVQDDVTFHYKLTLDDYVAVGDKVYYE